jgi:hypothetical protein
MNKIMHQIATLAILVMMAFTATAQSQGEITGRVLDDKKRPLEFVYVVLVEDDKGKNPTRATPTNADGYYTIKPLSPGKYNVMVKYTGFEIEILSDVQVGAGGKATANFNLDKPKSKDALSKGGAVTIKRNKYVKPLIDKYDNTSGSSTTGEEIKKLATRDVNEVAAAKGGVFLGDNGKISVLGSREDGTQYIIDGVKVNGSPKIASSSIGQLQVMSSGIDAKYGDLVGGVVNITTKDPAGKFAGSVEAITSHFLDNWSYNLANISISGPLVKTKAKDTTFTAKQDRTTILGYFLSGEFQYQRDRSPYLTGMQKISDSSYAKLIATPYRFSSDGSRILQSAELINASDIDTMAYHKNNNEYQARLSGKLNLKISNEYGLTFGGGFDKAVYKQLIDRYTLFNFDNNPSHDDFTYRGFARFRHNIGAAKDTKTAADATAPKAKSVSIGNAYYTFQVDYEKVKNQYYDGDHEYNLWNYGYIGKFERLRAQNVEYKSNEKIFYDSVNYLNMSGYVVASDRDTGVNFTKGTVNALGASITQFYLDMVKDKDAEKYSKTLNAIEQNGGLINGNRSNIFVHGLFHPYARQYNGAAIDRDEEQYRARIDASFDISKTGSGNVNKHAIEFGLEYEQRVLRKYSISPLSLWRLANLQANRHITRNSKEFNPTLHINDGKTQISLQDYVAQLKSGTQTTPFYITDTIVYEQKADAKVQTAFDRNLRSSLGLDVNGTDFIKVDALDPSQMNLNFFSADELLDNWGFTGVTYQGYDPYGNRLSATPSFKDFFTAKDANGNKTRLVDAFRPIYMAGYIQDKFQFEDLSFNVGLRIDRYDANQKVLKDKYSLYAAKTIGDLSSDDVKKFGAAPTNLTSAATVYTDKTENPSKVTGYREGDFWYDPQGNLISSPQSIISASGGNIQPYLLNSGPGSDRFNNMADSAYDPDASFTDFAPKWNFMPRLQFSFPLIKDERGEAKSLFFAHYDILTQRPDANRSFANARDWYLAFGKNFYSAVNNPNLKNQTTIDFQMGFKQLLSANTAITIATYYREFRDQIQFTKVVGAFPKEYFTYGNIDFGTSKGIQIDYEMRPTETNNLRIKVGYTLGFAEGTGSDNRTQFSLIESGNNNLRLISALNYDARHNLTISADYRFGARIDATRSTYVGPTGVWEKILQNFGVNIMANLRSGTPYTEQSNVSNAALISPNIRANTKGNINTARLPSRINVNLKIDKSFVFKTKLIEGRIQKSYDMNVYLQIKNLFNSENVRSVYRYTGNYDDDGYIASAAGLIEIAAKNAELPGSGDSYRDLYKVALGMPTDDGSGRLSNLAAPRTIQFGINFNF